MALETDFPKQKWNHTYYLSVSPHCRPQKNQRHTRFSRLKMPQIPSGLKMNRGTQDVPIKGSRASTIEQAVALRINSIGIIDLRFLNWVLISSFHKYIIHFSHLIKKTESTGLCLFFYWSNLRAYRFNLNDIMLLNNLIIFCSIKYKKIPEIWIIPIFPRPIFPRPIF